MGISIPTALIAAGSVVSAGVGIAGAAGAFNKKPVIPPSPMMPALQAQEQSEEAEAQAAQRQALQGGIQSTIGTSGGGSGAMLDPTNVGGRSLLGS